MKRLIGTDGRKKKTAKVARDERKLELREGKMKVGSEGREFEMEYGAEVDLVIEAALAGGAAGFCEIHGTALEEVNSPEAENGLVCWECEFELGAAMERSECLVHRLPLGYCRPCIETYIESGEVQP